MSKHVINFSGGLGSWAAARRVVDEHGPADVVLLFADVLIEDPSLYVFIDEASRELGVTITRIADGRNPMEVMRDRKIIGNSRIDPCSDVLKRRLMRNWRNDNLNPETDVLYLGIDWTEEHRLRNLRARPENAGWDYRAPLCEEPYLSRQDVVEMAVAAGLTIPDLYRHGFAHNNCGGACVKAGQAQWELLLRVHPDRYQVWEEWEQEMREMVGDYSILKDRKGGAVKPLTLSDFRARLQVNCDMFDRDEWGSCGCGV